LALCFTKLWSYFGEEISNFQLRWGRYSPVEIEAYFLRNKIVQPTKI